MHMYSFSKEDLEHNSEIVKDGVLYALYSDGLLTSEQIEKWSKTHAILLRKPSRISQWWYRILKGEEGPGDFKVMIATIAEIETGEA